jgi:hypothetical protein
MEKPGESGKTKNVFLAAVSFTDIFSVIYDSSLFLLQWAPLNGITLGPRQTDYINRMIPLTHTHFG